jgi:predicted kinase
MKRLYLIRGLPGSGKSTLARKITPHNVAADTYFHDGVEYRFDPTRLGQAHVWCHQLTKNNLISGCPEFAVHNTFSRRWEMEKYHEMARKNSYDVVEIDLFDGGFSDEELAKRNIHNVPIETIAKMRARWEK